MPFKKGQSGNKEGRPVGAKNKRTIAWELFTEFCMTQGLVKFQKEMDSLKGKQYSDSFLTLMEYFKPKLARTEIVGDADNPIQLNISNMNFKIKTKGESNK